MIITISGSPGSGKSTVTGMLEKKLNYKCYSVGNLRRQIASKRGMTLTQFNHWSETHEGGDIPIDRAVKSLGKKYKNLIVEGRLAWHFIPHSFKIFLYVNLDEGAKRIWSSYKQNKKKRNEDNISSLSDLKKSLRKRLVSDRVRYQKYYRLNIFDKKHYDFWLDVSQMDKRQEFNAVYKAIKLALDPAGNFKQ